MSENDSGETLLSEILANELDQDENNHTSNRAVAAPTATSEEDAKPSKSDKENHSQWALGGNGRFMPVGATEARLPAGIYEPFATPGMWGLELMSIASDSIYVLPDMATETVLDEVNKFWKSEPRYRTHNLLYKRGILLWGPPGSGKTVAVKLLMNDLVKQDGIVVLAGNINLSILCLKAVRRIEPRRNIIVVLEDIDEIIAFNGESVVLSMLDGENNIDNILHLATTNYPEKLGARIINRPSRFDRRVYVGFPQPNARQAYFEKATGNGLSQKDLARWVADTDEMSIAHMRELVAAVYCLDQPYLEVIERLRAMSNPIKAEDGFKSATLGFSQKVTKKLATGSF